MITTSRSFRLQYVLDRSTGCVLAMVGGGRWADLQGPFVLSNPDQPDAGGITLGDRVSITCTRGGATLTRHHFFWRITNRGAPVTCDPAEAEYAFVLSDTMIEIGSRVHCFNGVPRSAGRPSAALPLFGCA
jgi:hypothetical protein